MSDKMLGVSKILLNFIFGEPLPQPEVIEEDSDEAWQKWLHAVSDPEASEQFQMTTRLPLG